MRVIFILMLLFLIGNAGYCQTQDAIEEKLIHIKNQSGKIYSLGSPKQLQQAFGKASIRRERDEVLGGQAYRYRYRGLETYFNEQDWETTTITSRDYKIMLDNVACAVGDNINVFKRRFAKSYQTREKRGRNNNGFWLSILHNKQLMDSFIFIKYDDLGRISEITVTNDNS